jgi:hypothetical protein
MDKFSHSTIHTNSILLGHPPYQGLCVCTSSSSCTERIRLLPATLTLRDARAHDSYYRAPRGFACTSTNGLTGVVTIGRCVVRNVTVRPSIGSMAVPPLPLLSMMMMMMMMMMMTTTRTTTSIESSRSRVGASRVRAGRWFALGIGPSRLVAVEWYESVEPLGATRRPLGALDS